MSEVLYDKMLNIKSSGVREWSEEEKNYNRYEATPYFALEKLFKEITINLLDRYY